VYDRLAGDGYNVSVVQNPTPAQRAMSERLGATTAEVAAGHSVYLYRPDAVADLIRQAAGA